MAMLAILAACHKYFACGNKVLFCSVLVLLELRMMEVVSGNNWTYEMCKAAVKSSTPKNQQPVFLQAGCPSCRPANSVTALKVKRIICNSQLIFWPPTLESDFEHFSTDKQTVWKNRQQMAAKMKNFKHLYKDGEDDDNEDCRLKQVLVWYMVTVQHRDQTKRHSTAESAIRLKHDTSFK